MNPIKTYMNDETREYLQTYFLKKPCTPDMMDYLFYHVFNYPFYVSSSSTEFTYEDDSLCEIEKFVIDLSQTYIRHHVRDSEMYKIYKKGRIESWIRTENKENTEETDLDRSTVYEDDDDDEEYRTLTFIFWFEENGSVYYQLENEEEYILPIEKNMVLILGDNVSYKPYIGRENQQYIIAQFLF
jgi:hypothetical protein